ncbi:MAG: type 1 glutamine amidotransferase [Haloferacaceae archaeon]
MPLEFALLDASFEDDDAEENFRDAFDADVVRYAVRDGELPPLASVTGDPSYDGVVVSGSAASVYWNRDWIDALREWLADAAEADVPTLGVCFGHQLLADALGGRVTSMGEYELGYHLVHHDGESPLFAGLDDWFVAFTAHSDEVVELPDGATCRAENPYSIHAFSRGSVYGVQFHPEMSLSTAERLMVHRGTDGRRVQRMIEDVTDGAHNEAEDARVVFENFERIAAESNASL